MGQLNRAFIIMEYLKERGEASFGNILEHLHPISRTTLSSLLKELIRLKKITRNGRRYQVKIPHRLDIDQSTALTDERLSQVQEQLKHTAQEGGHACALFARVGASTMKIMAMHNLNDTDWNFSKVGTEWPLIPFHGFAKIFLAYSESEVSHNCYHRWSRLLRADLLPGSLEHYLDELTQIRQNGYALEYKEELSSILRLTLPVWTGEAQPRFVLGYVARAAYLLEFKKCLITLNQASKEISEILKA